jgi:hypothetical protein
MDHHEQEHRMSRSSWASFAAGLGLVASSASCALEPLDEELARSVAEAITAACPLTQADDEAERDACADRVGDLEVLRDTMAAPFLWGAQSATGDGDLESSPTTRFDPFVWRRLYLSVMMFSGEITVEHTRGRVVAHLPYRLRQLDVGAYPYPFWHKKEKWESYQLSTEILLFFEGGKLVGGLRSRVQDASRPVVEHEWDGQFRWLDAENREQPYVALYSYLLSPSNPHTAELDAAYRAFEEKSRTYNCATCHNPGNTANMNPLELFSYPNQALAGRHTIVQQLVQNEMPVGTTTPSGVGIADEAARNELIDLAKELARIGDLALAHEGETP